MCILTAWGGHRPQPNVNGLNGSLNLFQKTKISVKLAAIRWETVRNLLKQVNRKSNVKRKIISEVEQLTFDTLRGVLEVYDYCKMD